MKIYKFLTTAILISFFSCQSTDKRAAQAAIDRYVVFVDSVNKAKFEKRSERWNFIRHEHSRKMKDAKAALQFFNGEEQQKQRDRIRESDSKFAGVKATIVDEKTEP